MDSLPRKGVAPWSVNMRYAKDVAPLRKGPVADPHLRFRRCAGHAA